MIASTQYNDLIGTAAADITDFGTQYNRLEDLSKKFKLDESKLKLIGLTFYGINDIRVRLICIDILKSNEEQNHVVVIDLPENKNASLEMFFKRLEVTLYCKHENENAILNLSSERNWDDYMQEEE